MTPIRLQAITAMEVQKTAQETPTRSEESEDGLALFRQAPLTT
jgi:hypothetical protein